MINCENLGVKLSVNPVKIFVEFFTTHILMCKTIFFPQSFYHLFDLLFHKTSSSVLINPFSHFHSTYYYNYDILKINNINNRKV